MKALSICMFALVGCSAPGGKVDPEIDAALTAPDAPVTGADAALPDATPHAASSFDCVHGWHFEDGVGQNVRSRYSDVGVCLKWPRYKSATTMLQLKACSELPKGTNASNDLAFQQGCRPLSTYPAPPALMRHFFRPAFPMTVSEKPLEVSLARTADRVANPPLDVGNNSMAMCDPLAQTGCAANQKCTWIVDAPMPNPSGHLGCVPSGNKAIGEACMIGTGGAAATGFDNCQKGGACTEGVCKTVCNLEGGQPQCDASRTCVSYRALFGNDGQIRRAGICELGCDPVTQAAGDLPACGSPDPANPTRGCYGTWNEGAKSRFTCSAAGPADRRQDFQIPGGIVFLNVCAPGYYPGLHAGTGTMSAICSAFCNPDDVYQGHDQGKGGVKLPGNPTALATCADRGAI